MKVKLTETVLRDGHQSLIATRMSTADMLPILEKLDQVGYFSLEMWGGATFDVCLRYLNEDPWERLRQIRKHVKKTKLQMLLRGQNLVGYRHYPDDIVVKFVERAKANGIDIFRIFDAVNDIRNMTAAIKAAKKVGATVEGTISYTVSPVHTIEKFIKFAQELKEQGVDIICIKDMAGLISPVMAYDLTNALKKEVKLPVHLHSHCASGMAPVSYLTACEAGADILDTAISPFGWGTSQPPTETIVGVLKGTPFDTQLDLGRLTEISDHFQKVREKYKNLFDPRSERVDPKILIHQIPGGMLSNLISQLKSQNALDKYSAVLEETARVRKDLGYPPLVTPTSQIVGTQAVFNVVTGERYKVIPKEIKNYFKGLYGRSPSSVNEDVKKKAIGDEEPIKGRAADGLAPEFEKCREAIKSYSKTEEDALSYALFSQVAQTFFENRRKGIGPIQATPAPATAEKKTSAPSSTTVRSGKNQGEFVITLDKQEHNVLISETSRQENQTLLQVELDGKKYEVGLESLPSAQKAEPSAPVAKKPVSTAPVPTEPVSKTPLPPKPAVSQKISLPAGTKDVKVPMPGKVVALKVKPGDRVKKGDILLILEAMKMQNEIDAPLTGTIAQVNVAIGDNVDNTTPLIHITPG